MINRQFIRLIFILFSGVLSGLTQIPIKGAGELEAWFKDAATIYNNPDASGLQQFKLYLAYQHQAAIYTGEDRNGESFDDTVEEIRRFWLGGQGKFLNYFGFKAVSQIANDRRNYPDEDLNFEHVTFRRANVTFDLRKALNLDDFDSLTIGYGRRSAYMADEWQRSATYINVLERSDLSNKLWPSDARNGNPLAAWVKWSRGIHTVDIAMISGSYSDWIAGWDASVMYYSSWEGDFSQFTNLDTTDVWLSYYYQDAEFGEDRLAKGNEWAVSFVTRWGNNHWDFHTTLAAGDNGQQVRLDRERGFWGFVFMPMYWIEKDKQRIVGRIQYQQAEGAQGIRLNSRYGRLGEARDDSVDINSGRGDEHYSLYLGYNYYFAGHHLKIVNGLQWEELSSEGNQLYRGWSLGTSLRILF